MTQLSSTIQHPAQAHESCLESEGSLLYHHSNIHIFLFLILVIFLITTRKGRGDEEKQKKIIITNQIKNLRCVALSHLYTH